MTASTFRHYALALAFGVALIGASAAVARADDATSPNGSLSPSRGISPNQEQTAQPPISADSMARQQQLLNGPDPVINVSPYSALRNGAGEIVNPQTGTPLPWTVQPD